MTADAVGGVWSYALGLCAALPDIRFILATLGPRPRPAQQAAVSQLDNVILAQSDFRLEWMTGGQADITASTRWLDALAVQHAVDLVACQRLCPGPAWQRSPDRDRRPFRRAQLVERGARQSGTGGVARLSPRGGRRVARCRSVLWRRRALYRTICVGNTGYYCGIPGSSPTALILAPSCRDQAAGNYGRRPDLG